MAPPPPAPDPLGWADEAGSEGEVSLAASLGSLCGWKRKKKKFGILSLSRLFFEKLKLELIFSAPLVQKTANLGVDFLDGSLFLPSSDRHFRLGCDDFLLLVSLAANWFK